LILKNHKGGFGNLIALPLQKGSRDQGNTVFLDELFRPYADQWRFLESVQRIPADQLANIIHEMAPEGNPVGVHLSIADDEDQPPWHSSLSRKRKEKPIDGQMPSIVRVVVSNLVYIEKKSLPSAMVDRLVRVAAFKNPEFYRLKPCVFLHTARTRHLDYLAEQLRGICSHTFIFEGRDGRSAEKEAGRVFGRRSC